MINNDEDTLNVAELARDHLKKASRRGKNTTKTINRSGLSSTVAYRKYKERIGEAEELRRKVSEALSKINKK